MGMNFPEYPFFTLQPWKGVSSLRGLKALGCYILRTPAFKRSHSPTRLGTDMEVKPALFNSGDTPWICLADVHGMPHGHESPNNRFHEHKNAFWPTAPLT